MSRDSRRLFQLATLAAACALPSMLQSQVSTTRGLSVGVHVIGTSLATEGNDTRSGGGLSARLGYGFNRIVTGFVHIDGSEIEIPEEQGNGAGLTGAWSMAHAEVGARFHFANSLRRWVPYLETSAGARVVSVKDARVNGQDAGKVDFNGGAFTVGGGVSTFFRQTLAFDVNLKVTGGQFTEIDLGGVALQNLEIEATSVRFGVGIIWWPK
ncbi:MAG: outer membrane beta-barrel protein [Cytophagaceae bacterium]|nr:outer membrane beta-barrel protein [Gemmatimonadaceae bacterium]